MKKYTRTHTYQAAHVGNESNGTRWMAAVTDSSPYITVDLKEMRNVGECQFYFTKPTEEKKLQARSPHVAKGIGEARYLRLHILRGDAGLWEWKIYE